MGKKGKRMGCKVATTLIHCDALVNSNGATWQRLLFVRFLDKGFQKGKCFIPHRFHFKELFQPCLFLINVSARSGVV